MNDELALKRRKRTLDKYGLTEDDAEDLRQLIIGNQIAWVKRLRAEGKTPTEDDLEWLRERGIDPDQT